MGLPQGSGNTIKPVASAGHASGNGRIQFNAGSPIYKDASSMEFPRPIPLSQCGNDDAVKWLWYGYLASGHITILTAPPKCGKTTLLSWLLREFASGGNLAGQVKPCKALIVSEESKGLWARRRDRVGLGDHVHVDCRPFMGQPSWSNWNDYMTHAAKLVESDDFQLIVIDPIASLWPCPDENRSTDVLSSLTPLRKLTAVDAAVLLLHHNRKGDGDQGSASRGSGAIVGFADVIMELRRYGSSETQRSLKCYSRFSETLPEIVLDLADDGYQVIGSKSHAAKAERQATIREILQASTAPMTVDDVHAAWPKGNLKTSRRALAGYMSDGFQAGLWTGSGQGTKGDPYRFAL
jgi:RecA-family ATPase